MKPHSSNEVTLSKSFNRFGTAFSSSKVLNVKVNKNGYNRTLYAGRGGGGGASGVANN